MRDLTSREVQVLHLVAHGCTNGEIARRLDVEASTIKTRMQRIYVKTGTNSRARVVLLALRAGLIR